MAGVPARSRMREEGTGRLNPNSDDRQHKTVGEGKYGAVLRSSNSGRRGSAICRARVYQRKYLLLETPVTVRDFGAQNGIDGPPQVWAWRRIKVSTESNSARKPRIVPKPDVRSEAVIHKPAAPRRLVLTRRALLERGRRPRRSGMRRHTEAMWLSSGCSGRVVGRNNPRWGFTGRNSPGGRAARGRNARRHSA